MPLENEERELALPSRLEGSSPRGYHFINGFRECPRMFAFKWLLGLEPQSKKSALALGSLIHLTQEIYIRQRLVEGKSQREALVIPDDELNLDENLPVDSFDSPAARNSAFQGVAVLLQQWAEQFEKDILEMRILSAEEEYRLDLEVPVPDDRHSVVIQLTGRVDRVFQKRTTGAVLGIDTKSTSNKYAETVKENAVATDQFSMYTMLLGPRYPESVTWAIDVCAWKSQRFERSDEFVVPTEHVEGFKEGLKRSWSDVILTLESWEDFLHEAGDSDPARLSKFFEFNFPRYPSKCQLFGCEYSGICRQGAHSYGCEVSGYKRYAPLKAADLFLRD